MGETPCYLIHMHLQYFYLKFTDLFKFVKLGSRHKNIKHEGEKYVYKIRKCAYCDRTLEGV